MKKVTHNNLTWIDIKNTGAADIEFLDKNYNIHPLLLDELRSSSQRARVEEAGDHLYLVLHYPVFNKETRETRGRELDIIIGKRVIITSHPKSILPLQELFNQANLYPEKRTNQMGNTALLLYHIIENLLTHTLPKLDNISKKIDQVEENIFSGQEREMLTEISLIKRDTLNMAKAIKPQNRLLRSLADIAPRFFGKHSTIYFHDLLGSYDNVRSILNNHEAMIDSLATTNESLLSHKLNAVVNRLTIISFIALPLTLIASILGMNTKIKFLTTPTTFWVVISLMATLAIGTAIYFRVKKWL